MGRTALELVGQGMMGYSFDPLVEEVHNDFAEAVKSFVCVSSPQAIVSLLAPLTLLSGRRSRTSSGRGCSCLW